MKTSLVNNHGFITLDWIFGFILIFAFSALLFALSFTLTMVEITQYITFSAARNYFASHANESTQQDMALSKYIALTSKPVFAPLYQNGWFEVEYPPQIGNLRDADSAYSISNNGINYFIGVGTPFIARMLDFQIPFYGSTAPDGDGQGSGFRTYIGSYLSREDTVNNCKKFILSRWNAIRKLHPLYQSAGSSAFYYANIDNGC